MYYEYVMSKTMASEILRNRNGDEKKTPNQKYLVQYVNEQFGIKGECVKVSVESND